MKKSPIAVPASSNHCMKSKSLTAFSALSIHPAISVPKIESKTLATVSRGSKVIVASRFLKFPRAEPKSPLRISATISNTSAMTVRPVATPCKITSNAVDVNHSIKSLMTSSTPLSSSFLPKFTTAVLNSSKAI